MATRKLLKLLLVIAALVVVVAAYRTYLIHQLRAPVLAQLSDPASAQFQNERLFSDWTPAGSALCGQVNAKNKLGGYAGFVPFQAFPGQANMEDASLQRIKAEQGMDSCPFDKVAPWWHLRW